MQEIPKRIVQEDGSISLVCPKCGKEASVSLVGSDGRGGTIKVFCTCGKSSPLFRELRKAYRREVNLSGFYRRAPSGKETGEILVKNISMTGIAFIPLGDHTLSRGDRLFLQFALADKKQTAMEVVAEVVHTEARIVGCIFEALSASQEDDLVSFFMSLR